VFLAADGRRIPCVDLTQQLQTHGARGWSIEQAADGSIDARIVGGDADAVERVLSALLGRDVDVRRYERLIELGEGKPRRYRSAAG